MPNNRHYEAILKDSSGKERLVTFSSGPEGLRVKGWPHYWLCKRDDQVPRKKKIKYHRAIEAFRIQARFDGFKMTHLKRLDTVIEVDAHPVENPVIGSDVKPKADRCLERLARWIPRRYREFWVGDIAEDLFEMRKAGILENRLVTHVRWQFLWASVERLYQIAHPERWAWFATIKSLFATLRG